MTSITASNLSLRNRDLARQLVSFGAIGAVSTLAYVALYAAIRQTAPPALANAAALLITALGNTAANRRLTFAVRGRRRLARDHAAGLIALAAALAITSASLAVLPILAPRHGRLSEIAILVAANAVATLVRFLLLRLAIDRDRFDRGRQVPADPTHATLSRSKRTRG
ncbi:MAG TPA: GtrA family protein [Candidatus Limnocylindrales bacterium]|jgi:putative flippase GtrA